MDTDSGSVALTDGWMKARSKGQHAEAEQEAARSVPPPRGPQPPQQQGPQGPQQPGPPEGAQPAPDVQQAMQMLTLAQRTADEHVATAHRQAGTIQTEARAAAEQIVRDAQSQADAVRQQADTALTEARNQVEQASRDVQANADAARRDAEKVLADARAEADRIAAEARTNADGLDRLAKQRYEEEVGALAARREALQQQIESLQDFDRDYRSRLLTFMQAQLRALWADAPAVDGALPEPPSMPTPTPAAPAAAAPAAAAAAPRAAPTDAKPAPAKHEALAQS